MQAWLNLVATHNLVKLKSIAKFVDNPNNHMHPVLGVFDLFALPCLFYLDTSFLAHASETELRAIIELQLPIHDLYTCVAHMCDLIISP